MTDMSTEQPTEPTPVLGQSRPASRLLLLVGPAVLLGTLFLIHPDGSGGLDALLPVGDVWLALHVVMLPLLGLLGVSLYALLAGYSGRLATVGRIGVAVYGTFYVAFEAIAGVATGLLVQTAHAHPPTQRSGIAAAVEGLAGPSVALGFIGAVGALVAVLAVGIHLRRSGAPLVPVVLLGGAPLATVFHGGSPLDAVAMAAFVVGVLWLELGWRRVDGRATSTPI